MTDPSEDAVVYEYFPVSQLVEDKASNLQLHKFLLKGSNRNRSTTINVGGTWSETTGTWIGGENYEVGVISIDPAPIIPDARS